MPPLKSSGPHLPTHHLTPLERWCLYDYNAIETIVKQDSPRTHVIRGDGTDKYSLVQKWIEQDQRIVQSGASNYTSVPGENGLAPQSKEWQRYQGRNNKAQGKLRKVIAARWTLKQAVAAEPKPERRQKKDTKAQDGSNKVGDEEPCEGLDVDESDDKRVVPMPTKATIIADLKRWGKSYTGTRNLEPLYDIWVKEKRARQKKESETLHAQTSAHKKRKRGEPDNEEASRNRATKQELSKVLDARNDRDDDIDMDAGPDPELPNTVEPSSTKQKRKRTDDDGSSRKRTKAGANKSIEVADATPQENILPDEDKAETEMDKAGGDELPPWTKAIAKSKLESHVRSKVTSRADVSKRGAANKSRHLYKTEKEDAGVKEDAASEAQSTSSRATRNMARQRATDRHGRLPVNQLGRQNIESSHAEGSGTQAPEAAKDGAGKDDNEDRVIVWFGTHEIVDGSQDNWFILERVHPTWNWAERRAFKARQRRMMLEMGQPLPPRPPPPEKRLRYSEYLHVKPGPHRFDRQGKPTPEAVEAERIRDEKKEKRQKALEEWARLYNGGKVVTEDPWARWR